MKREQLTDWRQSRLLIGQPLAGLGLESDKALKSLALPRDLLFSQYPIEIKPQFYKQCVEYQHRYQQVTPSRIMTSPWR